MCDRLAFLYFISSVTLKVKMCKKKGDWQFSADNDNGSPLRVTFSYALRETQYLQISAKRPLRITRERRYHLPSHLNACAAAKLFHAFRTITPK